MRTGSPRPTTLEYEARFPRPGQVVGNPTTKISLPTTKRFGGTLFDAGLISDGTRRFVLADADPDLSTADQLPFAVDLSGTTDTVTNMHAQTVALDGGALLTTDLDGSPPEAFAEVLPPESGRTVQIATAPSLDGARMVLAEDGTVLAIGGSAQVAHYTPTSDSWDQDLPAGVAPGAIQAPVLTRLDDGTILVLGGTLAGQSTANAWLYRPSLVGPNSGQVYAVSDRSGAVLTATDPSTVSLPGSEGVTLTATGDDLTARVVVGGPRLATGTMSAVVQVMSGGVDLIAQQTGPARALVARLVPGQPASVERHNHPVRRASRCAAEPR